MTNKKTNTKLASIRLFTLSAVLAVTLPLRASGATGVPWNQVCYAASGGRLTIQTAKGEKVEGACVSTTAGEIDVSTSDRGEVKIARTEVARIDVQRTRNQGHQLQSLGGGLRWGLRLLLSPLAPVGLVVMPPILAWDAVVAPFCLIGDLAHQETVTEQITVI